MKATVFCWVTPCGLVGESVTEDPLLGNDRGMSNYTTAVAK
jgi:hypothetical protein